MSIEAILRDSRLLDDAALAAARAERDRTGERIDLAAVRLGLVQPGPLLEAIAERLELPVVELANLEPDAETLRALPSRTVFRLQCAPIALSGRTLRVVTGDPATLGALDELRLATGRSVEIALADPRGTGASRATPSTPSRPDPPRPPRSPRPPTTMPRRRRASSAS
jgi:type IV pilus assembly protein PilB